MDSASYCCHANPPIALSGWDRLPLSLSRSEALALETQQAAQQSGDGAMFYPDPVYLQLSQAERSAGVRV